MDRQHILDEIRRTAAANGGKPLGRLRLETETGIRPTDWMRYWPRIADAHREAGFEPNERNAAIDEGELLYSLALLARQLGRFPTRADLRVKGYSDKAFPSQRTFETRFAGKADMIAKVAAYCQSNAELADVLQWCNGQPERLEPATKPDTSADGFVYLMKSGHYCKIGKTNHVGRRERELAIQLPDAAATVHSIKTDDAAGIEAYWHRRFADRRANGEWFKLSASDVAAFKRRKFQ